MLEVGNEAVVALVVAISVSVVFDKEVEDALVSAAWPEVVTEVEASFVDGVDSPVESGEMLVEGRVDVVEMTEALYPDGYADVTVIGVVREDVTTTVVDSMIVEDWTIVVVSRTVVGTVTVCVSF